jgi:predicted nucleotidyltransferase
MTNLQTLTPIFQEFRQEVEKLYGARLVKLILFGSQARGEATQESDIDIMVVLKSPVLPGDEIIRMADIATQLDLKYNEFISLIPIAEEDFLHRQSPFMENIHREGIVL